MDSRSPFHVLSLCSGVGGLDLGLELAVPSARTVCYVEREAYCCAVLAARMEEGCLDEAPIWTDLQTFDGKPWRGIVDCITGGYPCQPFSIAGRRQGAADPRHLWLHIARIITEVQPGWCFFENVSHHLRVGFEQVHADLCRLGYRVAAGLFTATEVGASHRRERLFILADTDSGRCLRPHLYPSWRRSQSAILDSAGSSPVLADARCGGEQRRRDSGVLGGPAPEESGQGLQRQWPGNAIDNCCSAVFPPGPHARDVWDAVLKRRPDLAPALSQEEAESLVCGVADGTATRLDRLRASGNGVVPAVVAAAWHTLAGSLGQLPSSVE